EKVLAAHRAGIKRVILPERVRKDLNDVPDQAKKDIEFIFVSQMDEVLKNALESDPFKARAGTPDGGSSPDLPKPEVVPPAAPDLRAGTGRAAVSKSTPSGLPPGGVAAFGQSGR